MLFMNLKYIIMTKNNGVYKIMKTICDNNKNILRFEDTGIGKFKSADDACDEFINKIL